MRLRDFYHLQNLNVDDNWNPLGSILKYGRLWFHWPITDKNVEKPYRRQIQFSWHLKLEKRIQIQMDLFSGDAERDIVFCIAFLFFSLHLSLENFLPEKYGYPRHQWEHTTGFYLWDDDFRVSFHYGGGNCYECRGYKGWYRHWFVSETIFGRPTYITRVIERGNGLVCLQEGNATVGYPVKVIVSDDQWKFPRWPWPKVLRRASVESEDGIPIPGKGENSWDCGEDRRFSIKTTANTIAEAVEAFRRDIEKTRERRGGKNWVPEGL